MRKRRHLNVLCRLVSLRNFLCGVFLLFAWTLGRAERYYEQNDPRGMSFRHFQGIQNIMEVDCAGNVADSNSDILTVSMYSPETGKVIASANLKNRECTTSASFSLCIMDQNGHKTKVRTLVLDLGQKEIRKYACNVTWTSGGVTKITQLYINVTQNKITVSTISMLTSTTSDRSPDTSTPAVSESTGITTDLFDIHPGILITGVMFLLFFVILSIILIIMHIKERRRRHYLAEEYDTPLPVKSEYAVPGGVPRGVGEKERILVASRSPRPSTSSPLPHHIRKGSGTGSGGGGSMRYQQTVALGAALQDEIPGYLAGHGISVYYAEPWSGQESEARERTRPIPRGTPTHYGQPSHDIKGVPIGSSRGTPVHYGQIPHDSKGGPISCSAPPADDNP